MKNCLALFLLLILSHGIQGQEKATVNPDNTCALMRPQFGGGLRLSPPSDELELRTKKILYLVDAPSNFDIYTGNVPGVLGFTQGDHRGIVAQPDFLKAGEDGFAYLQSTAVLVHQIGHHELGHALEEGTTFELEQEANLYTGVVLALLGASEDDVEEIAKYMLRSGDDDRYPSFPTGIDAFIRGWHVGRERSIALAKQEELLERQREYKARMQAEMKAARRQARAMKEAMSAPVMSAPVDAYGIPVFELPPPDPSARFVLPKSYFQGMSVLGQFNEMLQRALRECGYFDFSYYAVPEGFALVTAIEQMDPETAMSLPEPDRWKAKTAEMTSFSLRDYLAALLFGEKGSFRVFAFVVTPAHFKTRGKMDHALAESWLAGGLNKLPDRIKWLPLTPEHDCTVLVYEFESHDNGEPTFVDQSRFSVPTHLERAQLMEYLQRR